ncbi:uncharacterized protein LOC116338124 [Contarinia nasturtii]|uniref:uncharacterized protein LOC116338124 n=1 Tax=Contarinia nasturtii TaxID=265458 RepID=UPI0012D412CF|nr:uncharacterized protein LOC116338124 [Contarinia nasturtii]
MDSDDNCLIIDESVSTTSNQTRSESDENQNGAINNNVNNKESDVSNASTPKPSDETSTSRSKERSGTEKSKTKEKTKTTTPFKEKRRSSSHRAHYIRLSSSVLKEKKLHIIAYKHQLYNMHFSLKGSLLMGETPSAYPTPPAFPDLSLTQLLHWPGIKLNISFDHFIFNHEIKDNCERDIVFGEEILVNIDKETNPSETRYLQQVPSSKTYPMVSTELMETYVKTFMEAAPHYDVAQSKLPEIEQSFGTIIDDISSVGESIQTRVTHSRFLNGQKYFRIFDNEPPENVNAVGASTAYNNNANKNNLKVRLRETINPEVLFWITHCQFTSDQINQWYHDLNDYFDGLLVKRNMAKKELLRDRFKKCLTLKCEKCNETFDGALWSVKLKDHIKQKHLVDEDWICVKCLRSWNQYELLQMGWKHDCTTGN